MSFSQLKIRVDSNLLLVLSGKINSIRRLPPSLKNYIEPNYGLLDTLVLLNVLTEKEREDILRAATVEQKNDLLLQVMTVKEHIQVQSFIEALELTHQEHLVNFICFNDGECIFFLKDLHSFRQNIGN